MAIAQARMTGMAMLRPSRWLTAWIVLAACAAVAMAWIFLPLAVAVAVTLAVIATAWLGMGRHALRIHPHAIIGVRWDTGGLECQLRAGAWQRAQVLPGGVVGPHMTVLRLTLAGQSAPTESLVLLPDAIRQDEFRRLRVYLRWRRDEDEAKVPSS